MLITQDHTSLSQILDIKGIKGGATHCCRGSLRLAIRPVWPVESLPSLAGHSGKHYCCFCCCCCFLVLIYRPASSVPSRVSPRPVSRSNSEAGLTGRAQGKGAGAGECCSDRRRVGRLIIVQHVSNKGQRQTERERRSGHFLCFPQPCGRGHLHQPTNQPTNRRY